MTSSPSRAEPLQEPSDGLRAPDRHDGDALGVEIAAAALGERLERALVADPFDEHDRTRVGAGVSACEALSSTPRIFTEVQLSAT